MNIAKYQAVHVVIGNAPANGVLDGSSQSSQARFFQGLGAPSASTLLAGNGKYNSATSGFVFSAQLVNGGNNYVVGDVLSCDIGSGTAAQVAKITVDTVIAGAIVVWHVSTAGNYSVYPANPVTTANTTGAGSGATFTLNFPMADFYMDMTTPSIPVLYVCTVLGDNGSSNWAQVSAGGSGGGGGFSEYNSTKAYKAGAIVKVRTAYTVGGVLMTPATYGCVVDTVANPGGNQVPQYPEPAGTIYWLLIAFGAQQAGVCGASGSQSVYVNSTDPF